MFDSLRLYDGPDQASDLLTDPICGSIRPTIPESSSNEVSVRFVTDDTVGCEPTKSASNPGCGFRLVWYQKGM